MAGQVRAKGEARRTRSDFMQMEKDRGISVSASAMSFEFKEFWFNLVDTESQTQKLFEVCRLRDLPILTFCNKMDRESREIFEIIDEIQENLAIDVTPGIH